uniref:Poly [ADP-ribose] polymerase n=1 Tax=Ciona intestinalis TaxID=7719 RepID=F7AKQ9_CIOIN
QNEKLLGNVLVTKGHNLHCQHVYHVLISKWDFNDEAASTALIKKVVRKALQLATQNNCTSIALPAIGCGAFGFPAEQVAKYMKQEFDNVQGKTTLRSIYINLHPSDVKIIQKFRNVFANDIKVGNSNSRNLQKSLQIADELGKSTIALPALATGTLTLGSVCLEVYEGDVTKETGDVLVNNVAQNQQLEQAGPLSKSIVNAAGSSIVTEFNTQGTKSMKVTSGGNLSYDMIVHVGCGPNATQDVNNIVIEALQRAEAMNKSTVVLPAIGTGTRDNVPKCAKKMRDGIDSFIKQNPVSVKSIKVVVFDSGMLLHFQKALLEKRQGLLNSFSLNFIIEYSISIFSGYPDVWKPMKRNEKLLTVDVDPWSDEFKKVLKEFKQSSSFIKSVVKLQRLQHPFQYDQFHSREKDVETELKSRNKTHLPVTRRLFHGTSPESCEKICKEGFNRSYAGKNATKYGKGMYFAVNSSYCHDNGFAQQGAGNCHMFLADVVTGEFGQGSPNSIVPPSTSSGNKESCHSAVDNTTNPSMFIVFRDYCVYPHYLLSYQK